MKLKKIRYHSLIFWLSISISNVCFCQKPDELCYFGSIDGNKSLYMILNKMQVSDSNDYVTGNCYYSSARKEIPLKGLVRKEKFQIYDVFNNDTKGLYFGKQFYVDSLKGHWTNLNGRTLAFNLTRINADQYYKNLYRKNFQSITSKDMQQFVRNFIPTKTPFEIKSIADNNKAKEIEIKLAHKYIKSDFFDSIYFVNRYYHVNVIFRKDYFSLLSIFFRSNGLTSFNEWFLQIHNYNYEGKLLDKKYDLARLLDHRGKYHATLIKPVKIFIQQYKICVIQKHVSLHHNNPENNFEGFDEEEVSYDTTNYHIYNGIISD